MKDVQTGNILKNEMKFALQAYITWVFRRIKTLSLLNDLDVSMSTLKAFRTCSSNA